MRNLLEPIVHAKTSVVLCRLVNTRGSTPQKPGAAMLVYPDGNQRGTIGGGCVEAEVKRQALAMPGSSAPRIVSFRLDHDYGWDDGLICGGRMDVMIWPIVSSTDRGHFVQLGTLYEAEDGGTEAITYSMKDLSATPDEAARPRLFVFDRNARLVGGLPEAAADDAEVQRIARLVATLPPDSEPCLREQTVLLPVPIRYRLVIVGAGHVGVAVAQLAQSLGFTITMVDDRQACLKDPRIPHGTECVHGQFSDVLPALPIDDRTFCLIVTRGHNHDQEGLYRLVNRGARYVGMIGSRRKIKLIFENLVAEGVDPDVLTAVYAPVGIPIGSRTVEEIAISIAAELVAVRRRSMGD